MARTGGPTVEGLSGPGSEAPPCLRHEPWPGHLELCTHGEASRFTRMRLAVGFGAMVLFVASGVAVRAGSLAERRFVAIAVLSAALWLLALRPVLRDADGRKA